MPHMIKLIFENTAGQFHAKVTIQLVIQMAILAQAITIVIPQDADIMTQMNLLQLKHAALVEEEVKQEKFSFNKTMQLVSKP